jgi:hypothetical protein
MVSSPTPAAAHSRAYRDRKAGRLPPVERLTCSACGAGRTGRHGELCSRCWERLTAEGRQAKAARVAKSRARRKRVEM